MKEVLKVVLIDPQANTITPLSSTLGSLTIKRDLASNLLSVSTLY